MCLERRINEQLPDEYKPYQRQFSSRFGLVLYDDRINHTGSPQDHDYKVTTKQACGHQQDADGGKTILVAKNGKRQSTKIGGGHPLQNVQE